MFNYGGHGVDVQLYDMRNTDSIFWTPVTCNSYVRVAVPTDEAVRSQLAREQDGSIFTNSKGEKFLILSVNGIGEIRWDVRDYSPKRDRSFLSKDDRAAVEYFTR